MPVPDFQTLMLPLLQLAGDGAEHTVASLGEDLAKQFRLSDVEVREPLPSGRQSRFRNRVAWAAVYLSQAELLGRPRRGLVQITPRGRDLLRENVPRVDIRTLMRYPEFQRFRTKSSIEPEDADQKIDAGTPEERLVSSYRQIRESLAEEVLETVKKCSPTFFEKMVLDLLVKMGYGGSRDDAERVGRSGDGGIDGIISEDKLGLDAVYVQAKRWKGGVGRPVVQAFTGALEPHRARKGVMITTLTYSQDAQDYVKSTEKKIVLLDGQKLAELDDRLWDRRNSSCHLRSEENRPGLFRRALTPKARTADPSACRPGVSPSVRYSASVVSSPGAASSLRPPV